MKKTKSCLRCKRRRQLRFYSKHCKRRDGLNPWCKSCVSEYNKQWRLANLDRERKKAAIKRQTPKYRRYQRDYDMRRIYGIGLKEYHDLRRKQKGVCLICQRYFGTRLVVDHNHNTGKVRGLLCYACNTGLHLFDRGPRIVHRVLNYLSKGEQL